MSPVSETEIDFVRAAVRGHTLSERALEAMTTELAQLRDELAAIRHRGHAVLDDPMFIAPEEVRFILNGRGSTARAAAASSD